MKSGRNVPLTVGAILCALSLAVAVFGPLVAPRDPLEFNYVAFSGDTPISPPFPPFTAAEFPLGSDAFGRDILSQLLWAVRPTLALAGLVAAVRLSLGALAGLVAGWRTDGPGRLANGAISAALSLPTLLVSLAAIAALGGRLGAGAFIIGLCLTGWAETARLFREETRIVRTQIYVEAARASGLSEWQIALRHGLRQLTPLAWQTFTFEISGTLLAIAALGFLGYYVGGVNWIMVGDFTARRISGWPELGQMLGVAAASELRATPWPMLITGGLVTLVILGFNLLGEGLRRRADALRRQNTAVGAFLETQLLERLRRQTLDDAARRRVRLRAGIAAGLVLALVAGALALEASRDSQRLVALPIPGGHIWSGDRHDASGTLASAALAPAGGTPQRIQIDSSPLAGSPAIAADGTLILASAAGRVTAIEPSGAVRWQVALDRGSVGGPGLSQAGLIFVLGDDGGVTALASNGAVRWRFNPPAPRAPLGPGIVSGDGAFYYATDGELHAIAGGRQLWRAPIPYSILSPTPRLSADSQIVFFKDVAFDAATGRPLIPESAEYLDQFLVGPDGRNWLISDKTLSEFRAADGTLSFLPRSRMNYGRQYPIAIQDAGFTNRGRLWLSIGNPSNSTRTIVWIDPDTGAVNGSASLPYRAGKVVAVDAAGTLILCGLRQGTAECAGLRPGAPEPDWRVELGEFNPIGAALAEGILYVAGSDGGLRVVRESR